MTASATAATDHVSVGIAGVKMLIRASDPQFLRLLEARYAGFTGGRESADYEFSIDLVGPDTSVSAAEEVCVRCDRGIWTLERGDFHAEWDSASRRGRIRQSANPFSIDSVLRIVHTLALAEHGGGFLLHAGSAIRAGRAYCFAGVSGAGKTTITRLAPPDVTRLTDEISCVRTDNAGYRAYGTPFAGELGTPGENTSAPLAAVYLLAHGPGNRIDDVPPAEAAQALLRNVLFFVGDAGLVGRVFHAACDLVEAVPVRRLTFVPDARVWEMIS